MRNPHDKFTLDLFENGEPSEPPEPADPWEHEPLPATYADDYPIDEPPPLASESDRAARDWAAGRIHD